MRIRSLTIIPAVACAVAATGACDAPTPADATISLAPSLNRVALDLPQDPVFLDPADAAAAPNPWFPLVPGVRWTYRADTEDGVETTVDAVTGETREVNGIETTVIRDEVYLDGQLTELTFDWYAQDTGGNVWYMGEASCEWEPGEYQEGDEFEEDCGAAGDPAGSWEAGVDGAEAGIIMWAHPLAYRGKAYRQEYYEGEAEDMARVLRGGLTVSVPAGSFTDCIETMDWTPLEPGAREHKSYCAGYGLVLEVHPRGGRTRNELVSHTGLPVDF